MLTDKLAEKGYDVTGIDDSVDMFELARKEYPDYTFVKGNAVDFRLNEKADVIFSNAVRAKLYIEDCWIVDYVRIRFRAVK